MIVNLSRDKTVLIGIDGGILDENSAEFRLQNNEIFLKDKSQRIRFGVSETIKGAIINKGYLLYCQKTPFSIFKVRLSKNGKK
jgi:hypothetical protein